MNELVAISVALLLTVSIAFVWGKLVKRRDWLVNPMNAVIAAYFGASMLLFAFHV